MDKSTSPFNTTIVQECSNGLVLDEENSWKVLCYPLPKIFELGDNKLEKFDWVMKYNFFIFYFFYFFYFFGLFLFTILFTENQF